MTHIQQVEAFCSKLIANNQEAIDIVQEVDDKLRANSIAFIGRILSYATRGELKSPVDNISAQISGEALVLAAIKPDEDYSIPASTSLEKKKEAVEQVLEAVVGDESPLLAVVTAYSLSQGGKEYSVPFIEGVIAGLLLVSD